MLTNYQISAICTWDDQPCENFFESGSLCTRAKVSRDEYLSILNLCSEEMDNRAVLMALDSIPVLQSFFDKIYIVMFQKAACELEIIFRPWNEDLDLERYMDTFTPRLLTLHIYVPGKNGEQRPTTWTTTPDDL